MVGAPVLWSRQAVKDGVARAVVLNSGGANVCTGPGGFQDAHSTAEKVAEELEIGAIDVLVASTGLIGVRLAADKLLAGVPVAVGALAADDAAGQAAATAIMTTDTVAKTAVRIVETPSGTFTVGGMAKGAGMLAPALATMLCVVTTDAVVPAEAADAALRAATRVTFDRVDSDGAMSTSDTVVLMASGASDATPDLAVLTEAVTAICADLARAARRRRRGRVPRHRHHRHERHHRGRRAGRRPRREPVQPGQGGGLRQRPQLGPHPRRRSARCPRTSRRSTPPSSTSASTG